MTATHHQAAQAVAHAPTTHSAAVAVLSAPAVPADLAELQLLDIKTVCMLVGLKPTAIYEREAAGTFPAAIRQGSRCTRWTAGSIRAWIQAQIEAQGSPQQQRAHQHRRAIAAQGAAKAQAKRQAATRDAA